MSEVTGQNHSFPFTSRTHSSFFYGPSNISAIRNSALLHPRHFSTFEVLTAFLWSCRAIALQPNPNIDETRILCIVNARDIFDPPLPRGVIMATALHTQWQWRQQERFLVII
ncbi:hypothetical protein POTOM_044246 [Populus tomentosa]|uniref:Uncharacterized protein n=1 Tax=Populus tomentosa TaxID=118781 RepID=A0A8X8CF20_POPTO|nr:hypothetical protein POTOM_044246 [Populus tomentosa]